MDLYDSRSPYKNTPVTNGYLDLLVPRPIDSEEDDIEFVVPVQYQYKPWLLAHDLYGDRRLWWVFAARNPDKLEDPISDMALGTVLRLPKSTTLARNLGL